MATTLNPSEISELIKNRIEKVKLAAEARNEGTVTSVSDGIVRIHGLADVMQGEMIELPNETYALALNLERDSVGAVVLGDYEHLREVAARHGIQISATRVRKVIRHFAPEQEAEKSRAWRRILEQTTGALLRAALAILGPGARP